MVISTLKQFQVLNGTYKELKVQSSNSLRHTRIILWMVGLLIREIGALSREHSPQLHHKMKNLTFFY